MSYLLKKNYELRFHLLSVLLFILIALGLLGSCSSDNSVGETTEDDYLREFYLADNGITIKCQNAQVGDTATINGVVYTKRRVDEITSDNASTTCVSDVVDMSELFKDEQSFDGDISSWDVSTVTDMSDMFYGAMSFDQELDSWDVSKVSSMENMFAFAYKFNKPIEDWNVQNVVNMHGMFYSANAFNQSLSEWEVSNVDSMLDMFAQAKSFNTSLTDWDVSGVRKMRGMFNGAEAYAQDLSDWCVGFVLEPDGFSKGSDLNSNQLPKWGECDDIRLISPWSGAGFITSKLISPSDFSTFDHLTYNGKQMRDINGDTEAYIFDALFDEGEGEQRTIEIQVPITDYSREEAEFYADKYSKIIGQLPNVSRSRAHIIHITSEQNSLSAWYDGGFNMHPEVIPEGYGESIEETMLHESSHVSLDEMYKHTTEWKAAQEADGTYISEYGEENHDGGEDMAESFVGYCIVKYGEGRVPDEIIAAIEKLIPHRIAFFESKDLDMFPLTELE